MFFAFGCWCQNAFISIFYLKLLAHKTALKTNENVRKSAKLEHQKTSDTNWENYVVTLIPKGKTATAHFSGKKYFVNDNVPHCTSL